ncbi:acyl-CoA dehydrogenase family protein [Bradyrhizobium sp. GCM10027634]|uniref:acyl-CoA dehydrogenase family protein n=1 Tax=unclassified Bradyrhizobium TaxID=2631580 RepID=UPI00188BE003|nr:MULTISPECIES: acyl-CoA dehydrogenase family protein [unclassified Bradyrhizobium]MDN5005617.1 acyl-CoA dehydrogenase family protein [Bradyrhizobium sp. WYCCWR 12677]QOZ44594.1 acyl-CoA dehydrogenase [Bradyrhizobium sp. CCBAU 53340]
MDEQRLEFVEAIRDTASAVAPRNGTLERVRKLRFTSPGFDPAVWKEMAGLGWIGLRLPESMGGVGMGVMEAVALHEELGRGLVPEPLIAASLAVRMLAVTTEQDLVQEVIAGGTLVALAWQETPDGIELPAGRTRCRLFVPMTGAAQYYLAPVAGSDRLQLRLFDANELSIATHLQQDGTTVGTVEIPVDCGRTLCGDVRDSLRAALDEAALTSAAYLLGLAQRAFDITLDYLKQRRQFDQPLAAFQALQHRAADLMIQLTLTRASIDDAAIQAEQAVDPAWRSLAISRAKARASDTALLVTREALQMHGAIGWADECDIGLFLRKALVVANQFGSALSHRNRFMGLGAAMVA